ncbi:DUF4189 domain-containing protein [Achromobacter sp. Root83]|uniref:DUF4189 domain-containing protein n=1 Tax=Achromobacter sp. Root83 TaxID=1736602 RepID=UPI0009ECC424|nr:DUF4189 domain-containing protein [Achromobacter sp. Root83]
MRTRCKTLLDAVPPPPRRAVLPRLAPGLLLFFACAAASDTPPQKLSDLYGALIVSSNYRYYASILYSTESAARQSALAACRKDEPAAKCTVYSNFKNQCIAVAAHGPHHFVATGKEDWDMQQTRDHSLRLCGDKTGAQCRLVISACSTQAQKAEDQSVSAEADAPRSEGLQAYLPPAIRR